MSELSFRSKRVKEINKRWEKNENELQMYSLAAIEKERRAPRRKKNRADEIIQQTDKYVYAIALS